MNDIKVRITKAENADYFGVGIGEIVQIPFENYLKGVVASEIGNADIEACKAQAVASRTAAYPYFIEGCFISDSSKSVQSFSAERMASREYPNVHRAVEETEGSILTYNGKCISPASFSSSNGGKTTSSESRWGGYRPYQIEQEDPWDYSVTYGDKTGHGVGLSQAGAKYAAEQGILFREILAFYYPGTELRQKEEEDMTNAKASYLIEKFKQMAEEKWKYEWGAAQKGLVDCSGAFTYWYAQAGSYMFHGSNTMWRKYTVERGKVGEMKMTPGMAVFKWRDDGKEPDEYKKDKLGNFYHVGQYIGNGEVIEAKSKKYGVVYSKLEDWSHAARLKNTDYDIPTEGGGLFPSPIAGTVKTKGGHLNVRSAPVNGEVSGLLENGQPVLLIGEENGWYMICYKGSRAYISGDYVELDQPITYTISIDVNVEEDKDAIVKYLEDMGYQPTVTGGD